MGQSLAIGMTGAYMANTKAKGKKDIRSPEADAEIMAMSRIYDALDGLDSTAQSRVIRYVAGRLGLSEVMERGEDSVGEAFRTRRTTIEPKQEPEVDAQLSRSASERANGRGAAPGEDESLEMGLSPVALKWMKRGDISSDKIAKFFTIGVEEIDLVAKDVPGKNKAEKFRSVMLLKGVASYLGSGQPKVDHKALKEAAGHYRADPGKNVTTYIKNMGAEVSGTAATGYTLTPRGLAEAQELIRSMIDGKAAGSK
jgi:hypothetical protein